MKSSVATVEQFCADYDLSRDAVEDAIAKGLLPTERVTTTVVLVDEVDEEIFETLVAVSEEENDEEDFDDHE